MRPFWSGSAASLLATKRAVVIGVLAEAQMRHHRTNEVQQLRAWEDSIDLLCTIFRGRADAADWHVLLEYPLLRLGRRADAVILAPHAVVVLEFKIGAERFDAAAREQVEDYALDLRDFHAGCRRNPIIPVLVASHATARPATLPLLLEGVSAVIDASAGTLPAVLLQIGLATARVAPGIDVAAWLCAPYRPVPGIVEAACMLYARHSVEEITAAKADATNLTRTTDAIMTAMAVARSAGEKLVVFVTGIPGAGKTLCGLNACFGASEDGRATFLTGNPTLVHVLREALARDAIGQGQNRRVARQQMEAAIQALPRFRDHYVATGEVPAERIVVVDEAQRCWSAAHAIAKTRDRPVRLSESEPAHLLAILARHAGFAGMICLVGHGQEIHDGEGGLAEWGAALRESPCWQIFAPPDVLDGPDQRQRLGALERLRVAAELHLDVPVRQLRNAGAPAWVDHVLAGRPHAASAIARTHGGVPFLVTRSLPAMRDRLRAAARGTRRAGLLASSGATRLRAEGLGAELPHMDPSAVARWFLDRWPDVRASDALELVATEFSCQGLELDYAGLCWDGDLVREVNRDDWRVRDFRGTSWTLPAGRERITNRVNAYRVLLTRARYETVIYVPRGEAGDRTRNPAIFDDVASFLHLCGAGRLDDKIQAQPAIPNGC